MAVPLAADRLGIDLKHPVTSCPQPRHEQASAGFYRHIHPDELAPTGVLARSITNTVSPAASSLIRRVATTMPASSTSATS